MTHTTDLERRLRESAQMTRDDVFQAEPDLLDEAADEIARLRAENETLREALKPFGCDDFECPVASKDGWTEFGITWCRERIVDWFGPSDFRRAAAAIRNGEAEQ